MFPGLASDYALEANQLVIGVRRAVLAEACGARTSRLVASAGFRQKLADGAFAVRFTTDAPGENQH